MIVHADLGRQDTSEQLADVAEELHVRLSVGRTGVFAAQQHRRGAVGEVAAILRARVAVPAVGGSTMPNGESVACLFDTPVTGRHHSVAHPCGMTASHSLTPYVIQVEVLEIR